jgi:hypothetical protein
MKKIFALTLTLGLIATSVHGQGTIAFANSALTRVIYHSDLLGGESIPLPTNIPINYGVFWGTSVNGTTAWHGPVLPLGVSSTTTAGLIVAPSIYAIPGTEADQRVLMQIFGWSASFGADVYAAWQAALQGAPGLLYGATDIREVTLGDADGPGTVIWQTATGTDPDRFRLALWPGGGPPPPTVVPEASTLALGALAGLILLFRRSSRKLE